MSDMYSIIYDKEESKGILDTSGDNTVIDAPGEGKTIYIKEFQFQSESSTANVIIIKKGSTEIRRFKLTEDGDGLIVVYGDGDGDIIGENTAYVVNLSESEEVNYYVDYEIRGI